MQGHRRLLRVAHGTIFCLTNTGPNRAKAQDLSSTCYNSSDPSVPHTQQGPHEARNHHSELANTFGQEPPATEKQAKGACCWSRVGQRAGRKGLFAVWHVLKAKQEKRSSCVMWLLDHTMSFQTLHC